MTELCDIIHAAAVNHTPDPKDYACQYCGKRYRRESTLAAHLCERKRRAQQEHEAGVVLGYTAYLKFYEQSQGSARYKTYQDFSESPYYGAFVKFGRHMTNIRAIRTDLFIEWILRANKRLDHWCRDEYYQEYLYNHLRTEHVQDAVERTIKNMTEWAESREHEFMDYFRQVNSNRLVQDITTGRTSAWVVFNCASARARLDTLNAEQIELIVPYVDPDFWKRKFQDHFADTEWVKHILEQAGL